MVGALRHGSSGSFTRLNFSRAVQRQLAGEPGLRVHSSFGHTGRSHEVLRHDSGLIGAGKTAEGAGHKIRNSGTVTFLLCTSSGGVRLTKGRAARYFRVIRRGGAVAKW